MTDLLRVLPTFPVGQYASLIPGLEKHQVTVSDLLTLEVADIGKRTQLPLLDLKRLCNAVLGALHSDLGVSDKKTSDKEKDSPSNNRPQEPLRQSPGDLKAARSTISTLDETLDAALGGGIPTGYVTEITGESGAGKTQFLLSLLLAVQLPPPYGLSRPALYISTEAALSTRRLSQMLNNNPLFNTGETRPSLDNIVSTATPDLESQDHILTYQVPVEVERRNVGLIVLDSVAANYRAEFERGGSGQLSSNMGARSAELVRLGMLLRDLARKYNLAVVVANQVADRFGTVSPVSVLRNASSLRSGRTSTPYTSHVKFSQDSPLASRSRPPAQPLPPVEPSSSMADALPRSSMPEPAPPPSTYMPPPPPGSEDLGPPAPPALMLDHQQRWFTGWGDDPFASYALKTPSLGLVWSTQIACRIALFKKTAYGLSRYNGEEDEARGMPTLKMWRRWMKVVFAPHVAATGPGLDGAVEFEVNMGGLRAVTKEKEK
ncbi:putative dna repair protein rad57 protein [Phaeoacremonium minimum UCRPA7]|uniref:Putative dna repair protein rad57 protein n=1 Tax=Phaeoacremonium minimum (strain UCR-PA7) TaxID=1286976 RepID=R8BL87_PHAM7|nr:putative dna repair protein rad57 protein [Phaeoacremonium minimum UCRPA7]EOO00025.1 putative dna repair protein rad57 protein [Phaeoacremonium minimum UCRPA7]